MRNNTQHDELAREIKPRIFLNTPPANISDLENSIRGFVPNDRGRNVDEHTEMIGSLIVDRIPYLDTVHVRSRQRVTMAQLAHIQAGCGGKAWQEDASMFNQSWPFKMVLQQPTDELLEYLDDMTMEWLISRVDVALDLTVAEEGHADLLKVFMDRHLVKQWHGKQELGWCNGTAYSSRTPTAANILVAYADRPSKMTPMEALPCFHLEWKCGNPGAVRRAGIDTFWDLVDFNHHQFWHGRMVLEAVDFMKLGAALKGPKRRKPTPQDAVLGRSAATVAHVHDMASDGARPHGSVQSVKDYCRRKEVKPKSGCFSRLPNAPFLPE